MQGYLIFFDPYRVDLRSIVCLLKGAPYLFAPHLSTKPEHFFREERGSTTATLKGGNLQSGQERTPR